MRGKRGTSKRANETTVDFSMMASEGSESDSNQDRSMQSYQVGEIDENGFVCIGIEERKVQNSKNLNKTTYGRPLPGLMGSYNESASDYSSSEEYASSGD